MSTEPSGLRASSSFAGPTAPSVGDSVARPPDTRVTERRPVEDPPADAPAARRRPPGTAPPRRKRKARKVHRVVRHLDVWSVAKVTAVFVACGYVIGMISGYLLWRAADRVGTIDGIEGFIEDSGSYETFEILGDVVFRVAAVSGLVLAVLVLALAVLVSLLFNLISDLTGGIRMTVIDEDLIVAPARRPPSGTAPRPGPVGEPPAEPPH